MASDRADRLRERLSGEPQLSKKKEAVSDFRYATGPARVPWAAVGENVRSEDLLARLRLLVRPAEGKEKEHRAKRRRVTEYLNRRFAKVAGIVVPPLDDEHVKSTHLPLYDYDAAQVKYMADAVVDAVSEVKRGV